jgi:hypothetical protein
MKSHRFAKPIILKDGAAVDGLADARSIIHNLPEEAQLRGHWKYARELLARAFERDDKYSVMDVRNQFERALKEDGLA